MLKCISAAFCLSVFVINCLAQDAVPEKKFKHYAGFQANELLRQLFNFAETNSVITNPYLGVYSIICTKSNIGAHVGIGYVYNRELVKESPANRESRVNDLFFRVGVEKKFQIGRRFEGGMAIDFVGSNQRDKTFSRTITNLGSQIDSSESTVTDKITSFGGGPQFSLSFLISEKILLGTEATMYYTSQTKKENVLVLSRLTDIFNNQTTVTTSNFNSEIKTDDFNLSIPIALFLIIKF